MARRNQAGQSDEVTASWIFVSRAKRTAKINSLLIGYYAAEKWGNMPGPPGLEPKE
jgi:hypothetical protein